MTRLWTIIALANTLALAPTPASAAVMAVTVSGTTTASIHDGTDYFGFGSGIPGGTPFSMTFTFDPDISGRITGQGPSDHLGGRSVWRSVMTQCCEPSSSPPFFAAPGPSRFRAYTLSLNGKDLTVSTDIFPAHEAQQDYVSGSTFIRTSPEFGQASSQFEAKMSYVGSAPSGDAMTASFRASFVDLGIKPSDVQPVPLDFLFTSELFFRLQGTANIALLLLNPDGSTAIDLGNGTSGGFAISRFYQAEADVPLPAALPLLVAGIATLLGIGSTRNRAA